MVIMERNHDFQKLIFLIKSFLTTVNLLISGAAPKLFDHSTYD